MHLIYRDLYTLNISLAHNLNRCQSTQTNTFGALAITPLSFQVEPRARPASARRHHNLIQLTHLIPTTSMNSIKCANRQCLTVLCKSPCARLPSPKPWRSYLRPRRRGEQTSSSRRRSPRRQREPPRAEVVATGAR